MPSARVVLVTGAAAGIGLTIADGLEARGFTVARVDGAIASEPDAQRLLAAAADRVGRLDAVVHAIVEPDVLEVVPLAQTDAAAWNRRCEHVLRCAVWCTRAAWTQLRAGGGRIVFLTPTVSMTGAVGLVPYAAAVEGIRALAKSAARQWGAVGITVACVAPPVELMVDRTSARTDPTIGDPALGRNPEPGDVVPVVAMLLGDDARGLTGSTVVVDGGVVMTP
jgi:3-oxoacyl-[acyl-carrier protein] reductase